MLERRDSLLLGRLVAEFFVEFGQIELSAFLVFVVRFVVLFYEIARIPATHRLLVIFHQISLPFYLVVVLSLLMLVILRGIEDDFRIVLDFLFHICMRRGSDLNR